uniref:Guanine nucleotide-binding protein subunit beta-like protein 1 n=1 Tax=Castor canadensis TaxID=51338 RepID=A0A8C0W3C8_CASCN
MADPLLPPPPDPQFVLRGMQSAVNAVHLSRRSQAQECPLLFSGSQSSLVQIWSLQTRKAVTMLDGHGGQSVTWLQFLPQGSQLLSQGRDQRLCLWDLTEGTNTVVDSVHLESVGFCRSSVLAYGQLHWTLAMPGKGTDEVQILEMPSKTSVCTLKPDADAKPGMPMCLGLWQDGSVAPWYILEQKVCSRVTCHEEPIMALDFDSQKVRGISGSAGKALACLGIAQRQSVCSTHELTNPGIADVTIQPDQKILATADWDQRIRVFQWWTMKPLAVLAFATDGLLAAGSKDQHISVCSLCPPCCPNMTENGVET